MFIPTYTIQLLDYFINRLVTIPIFGCAEAHLLYILISFPICSQGISKLLHGNGFIIINQLLDGYQRVTQVDYTYKTCSIV